MHRGDRNVWMALYGVAVLGLATTQGWTEDVLERSRTAQPAVVTEPSNRAPDFTLPDTLGNKHTLSEYLADGKIVVLEWFNPNCTFDTKYHGKHSVIRDVQQEFSDRDVVWLAINSGCLESGTADIQLNETRRQEWDMQYPVLLDPEGKIGRLYKAKTTPQFFLIDQSGIVQYEGAFDNCAGLYADPGSVSYVKLILTAITSGEECKFHHVRAVGCGVKYGTQLTVIDED